MMESFSGWCMKKQSKNILHRYEMISSSDVMKNWRSGGR